MKLAVLFSGGKDSALAMFKAMKEHEIVCLISILSKNKESYMYHTPNIELTKLQAEAINLPIILKSTPGEKEEELKELKEAIQEAKEKYKIQGVVTGAVESIYQSSRIQKICDKLNLKCINPLWKMNQIKLLGEVVDLGFNVFITGVFAYPLTEEWLGKTIDKQTIRELKKLQEEFKISPAGEGGEIETTVLDAPFFKKKITIKDSSKTFEKNSGVLEIKEAVLEEK